MIFNSQIAVSHPHSFIENTIKLKFDSEGFAGFNIQWQFDEVFSEAVIDEYDRDGDRIFSADEVASIKEGAFSNLKQYNYFCDISIDGKSFDVQYIQDFRPTVFSNKLVYSFLVPCHVKAANTMKTIKFCMFDPTNFIDIQLTDEPEIIRANTSAVHIKISKDRNPDKSWLEPEELTIRFKKQEQ
jgi:ABC-type uncharacterized transport system substrate-binding protein